MATITSKRQITIPVSIYKKAGLKKGEKVIIAAKDNIIEIIPSLKLVDALAGSVEIKEHFSQ